MDIAIVLQIVAFAVLMGFSAFFSSSETALFSLNQLQLEQMRRSDNPRTALIQRLLSPPRQLIVTILIGNEFVNVAASVISAALVIRLFGSDSKWINLLIMVPILLLVGEITPKTLAIRNNLAFASAQCRFIDFFARAIGPLRWVVRAVAEFFITLMVGKERSRANILTEDMVRVLAQEAVGAGALDRREATYINRIFDFGDKVVSNIMTPQSQVHYLPASATIAEAIQHYHQTNNTKVPIHGTDRGTVIGILYARDLLREELESSPAQPDRTVATLVRPAYFVPESKSVADLFYTFRKRKLSLALTLDEFGGVTGLVSMEDLLECIFGEIVSSSELIRERALQVETVAARVYRIDGAMTLRQFNTIFRPKLTSTSADTIGGLLLDAIGELPAETARIMVGPYEFAVEAVANQRIVQIRVHAPQPPVGSSGLVAAADQGPTESAGEPAPKAEPGGN